MDYGPALRLLLVFGVVFSLPSLLGPLTNLHLVPTVPLALSTHPGEPWYPAGPSMDKLVYDIFSDEAAEFTGLLGGLIDLTDWPLTPALVSSLISDPNFFVTPAIAETGYFELQFHLGSNFWGCNLDFGNSACGTHIRQAIAHGLDKTIFTNTQSAIAGNSIPIDNPIPQSVTLVSPNPCSWDSLALQTGPNCVVGAPGGTAYHLAAAIPCNVPGGCSSIPTFSWTSGLGTPDFCAAADHLIAAGLAASKNLATCVLAGVSPAVSANPINIFVRSDHPPRFQAGQSYAQAICALFTGSFTAGCAPILTVTGGTITSFPGFTTSPTTVEQDWNVYTGGFTNIITFDASTFFSYHSQFVSGIPSIKQANGGPCSNDAFPTFAAGNYMYMCRQAYDTLITQAEFAPCLSAAGDPVNGQLTPTFANCPGTTQLSSRGASYQAQDTFGQGAYTIPMWSGAVRFGYRSNWQRVFLHKGNGFVPPGNIFAEFNAWSPNPAIPGTIRQGFKEATTSVNPFVSNTS